MRRQRVGAAEALVGRLDDARAGAGSALVLRGATRTPRTRLVDELVAAAAGWHVVRATARAAERSIPAAGLSALLHRLGAALPRLQQRAAQLMGEVSSVDATGHLDLGTALVALLEATPGGEPVLLVVEDVHHLDDRSADLLMFAAARVRTAGLLLVLACGEDDPRFLDGSVPTTDVTAAVTFDQAGDAVTAERGVVADEAVLEQLLRVTDRSPVQFTALVAALSDEQLLGWRSLPIPLPAVGPLPAELGTLDDTTRAALAVAALSCSSSTAVVGDALARLGRSVADIGPAIDGGILRADGGHLRFAREDLRAHAAAALPARDVAAAHGALAAALAARAPDELEHRAHHLAGAGDGDGQLALLLTRAAERARADAKPAAAARASATAAEHTADPDDRARLLVAAAWDAASAGAVSWAAHLAERADRNRTSDDVRTMVGALTSQLQLTVGSTVAAHDAALRDADRLAVDDPPAAARALVVAAASGVAAGRLCAARAAAERAENLAPPGSVVAAEAGAVGAMTAALLGAGARVVSDLLGVHPATLRAAPLDGVTIFCRACVGMVRIWHGAHEEARRELHALVSELASAHADGWLGLPLAGLALADLHRGWWEDASDLAHRVLTLPTGAHESIATGDAHVVLALLAASRGEVDHCGHHVAAARRVAAMTGAEPLRAFAAAAEGRLDLGMRNPSRAAVQLEEAARIARGHGLAEAAVVRIAGDLLVALVTGGRRTDAQAVLENLEVEAERTGTAWTRAAVHRGCALVALGDDAIDHLDRADELLRPGAEPFDRGLNRLLAAGVHLQAGRGRSAAAAALAARELFDPLRAIPWSTRAQRLAHEASRSVPTPQGRLASLSAQERRVAALVVGGGTNRQIAATLVVSQKTVEFHLRNVFRKLEVTSRAELAALVGSADLEDQPPPVIS